jgi:peptide/nickel transport system substrate-binding protein
VTQGEPRQGGEVVVHLFSEPPSLNTHVDADTWGTWLTEHRIYESLVGIDPHDHPRYGHVPELARRWDIRDDHRVYTFHLREDVRWHDGEPFTAEDVIATFDKITNEATRAAHRRSYLQELESYEALDEHTVRFKWERPYFIAMDDPFYSFPIYPAHVIEELSGAEFNEAATNPLNRHPIGTGPWKFVEWQAGEKIVLERNDEYWGDGAHLDRLVFRLVEQTSVALQLAKRGELDVVTRVSSDAWVNMDHPTLRNDYHRSKYYDANYTWIGWNQRRPYFSDRTVRRALAKLVDRSRLAEELEHGLPKLTDCHFYWASPACDFEHERLGHDPAEAAKMLGGAGWKDRDGDGIREREGTEFEFTFLLPSSSSTAARIATKLKEDFGRAGIETQIERIKWSSYMKRLRKGEFDAAFLIWTFSTPRIDPTTIWHSSSIEGGSNYVGFSNERADTLMEKARTTFDRDERNRLYRELGQILYREQPYLFMWVRPRLQLLHERIQGAHESLMFWQFRDWWLQPPRTDGSN